MKKRSIAIILCCALLLLCGCNSHPDKYKRISFESESMGEQLSYIKDDMVVVNKSCETFSAQMPIYQIKQQVILEEECQKMLVNLGLDGKRYFEYEHNGNYLDINLASRTDFERGYFNMTEDAAKKLAWELFNKIPFMEGEYECLGIRENIEVRDAEGSHIARAGVVFCRMLDGLRVTGDENCTLYFDGSGLVEIRIRLYDYEKVGMMDVVSLMDAESQLKTPDDFDIRTSNLAQDNKVDILKVENVYQRLVNQHSNGCEILQPIYFFKGTATLEDNTQAEFSSKIIAIPESMTYED
jgi:hypothetical protein